MLKRFHVKLDMLNYANLIMTLTASALLGSYGQL